MLPIALHTPPMLVSSPTVHHLSLAIQTGWKMHRQLSAHHFLCLYQAYLRTIRTATWAV